LLQGGARGGDDADGAAPDHIGETERNPVEDGGAAVRPHDQEPMGTGVSLEGDFILDRDIVAGNTALALSPCAVLRPALPLLRLHRAYAALLMREIDHVARLIRRRAAVSHVHWGGGTPTSLPGDCLIAIMDRLKERFAFEKDAEIAIEIDPTSLPPDRREALGRIGVTRVSLGVQDLELSVQRAIGRVQSYEETEACADAARSLGAHSLNLDLIYGLPLQTKEGVARTARRALDLKADRISVFGYAHVPWMKRHQALIAEEFLPGPVARYEQLSAIHRVLTQEGGYVAVGLDHYALPGDAMAKAAAARRLKRGFQGYTTDAAPALIGFGASSIGSLPQGYVQNAPTAAAYAKEIEADRLATARGIALSADDRLRRDVIERTMCNLEVDIDAVAAEHCADSAPLKAVVSDGILQFEEDGLASWDGRRIVVGERGRPFVRSIAALFDLYLARQCDKPRHSRAV